MIEFNNEYLFGRDLVQKAKKGEVYVCVTNAKELYVIKQTGARSWDAVSADFDTEKIVHGSRADILDKVYEELDVHYMLMVENKKELRRAIFEHLATGRIGDSHVEINVTPINK